MLIVNHILRFYFDEFLSRTLLIKVIQGCEIECNHNLYDLFTQTFVKIQGIKIGFINNQFLDRKATKKLN